MPNIKFSINKNKANKLGLAPIRATITFQGKNHRKNIESIQPRYWNPKKQRVTKNRESEPDNRHAKINKLLDDYQAKANDSFNYCKLKDIPITEKIITGILNGNTYQDKSDQTFDEVFEKFLEDSKATKAGRTYLGYQTAQRVFKEYQEYKKEKLTFDQINQEFFDSFKDYCYNLRKIQMSTNYFAKNTAVLKTFLNWSKKRKYYEGSEHDDFEAPEKDIDKIFLTVEEFVKLRDYNFTKKHLERVRDIFIFGCYTGFRWSDLQTLRREHIKDGYFEKVIVKTKRMERSPISDQAKKIIDKYEHPVFVLPKIESQPYNRQIKKCCELAGIDTPVMVTKFSGNKTIEATKPKYELITAHTSRKTAATLLISLGTPESYVKNVTGHKTDREFQKYVGNVEEITKTETQKSWNKLPKPETEIIDPEAKKLTEQIIESLKNGKINKETLQELLNRLNEQKL